MKTKLITQYIFNFKEKNAIENYIRFLSKNPFPCTECPAQNALKCEGYDIFSQELSENETCQVAKAYFENYKHEINRLNFKNLDNEEVKKMILHQYYLELAKQKNYDINVAVLVAQHKVDADNERIVYGPAFQCNEYTPMFEFEEGEAE